MGEFIASLWNMGAVDKPKIAVEINGGLVAASYTSKQAVSAVGLRLRHYRSHKGATRAALRVIRGDHNGVLLAVGVTYTLAERTIGGESYDILGGFRHKERLVSYQVLHLLDGFFYTVKGHQAIADITVPNPRNIIRVRGQRGAGGYTRLFRGLFWGGLFGLHGIYHNQIYGICKRGGALACTLHKPLLNIPH